MRRSLGTMTVVVDVVPRLHADQPSRVLSRLPRAGDPAHQVRCEVRVHQAVWTGDPARDQKHARRPLDRRGRQRLERPLAPSLVL
eukprot:3869672-Rhodomonas_salina.2